MNFEIKKTQTLSGILPKDASNSKQSVKVTVGVIGCPYEDIVSNKVIDYIFPNTTSIEDAITGLSAFTTTWLNTNYPTV